MNTLKTNLKFTVQYAKAFIKWIIIALAVGFLGGVVGSLFHESVDYVTHLRTENPRLIYLLPAGGIIIAAIYRLFRRYGRIDTNRVLEAAREHEKVPLIMAPLIFISTVITHLLGGSAGREGAALQLGGSIGYNVGRAFRLRENDMHLIVMAGMSSVFSALFGTPLTAAFFSLEVVSVGVMHYAGLVPCIISSVTAYGTAQLLGVAPVRFLDVEFCPFSADTATKVIILSLLCAVVSIIFCTAIKKCEHYMEKLFKNVYIRGAIGGGIIVILTLLVGTYDYNGAGMDIIQRAMEGEAETFAFALKILFTAITISAGFKGGEIVPTFFIGSTFGCAFSSMLGLSSGFGAAIGFVALFCSVVNCPVASVMLAMEVFGGEGMLFFAVACGVSYMMSGCFGLYKSQKILFSKLDDHVMEDDI